MSIGNGARMKLLRLRPASAEQELPPDERRIRDYMHSPGGVSESAASLADKMGISRRRCRGILEQLVEQGVVRRRDFLDIEPIYLRFPSRLAPVGEEYSAPDASSDDESPETTAPVRAEPVRALRVLPLED